MIYEITPVAKPRMTQRDKWKKRPVVLKYNAFKDECRLKGVYLPVNGARVIFAVPMPQSWTKREKDYWNGKPHRKKPDIDNLLKALMDAVFDDDSGVSDVRITKIWAREGHILINEG